MKLRKWLVEETEEVRCPKSGEWGMGLREPDFFYFAYGSMLSVNIIRVTEITDSEPTPKMGFDEWW